MSPGEQIRNMAGAGGWETQTAEFKLEGAQEEMCQSSGCQNGSGQDI